MNEREHMMIRNLSVINLIRNLLTEIHPTYSCIDDADMNNLYGIIHEARRRLEIEVVSTIEFEGPPDAESLLSREMRSDVANDDVKLHYDQEETLGVTPSDMPEDIKPTQRPELGG
jgi:hypothetical protein